MAIIDMINIELRLFMSKITHVLMSFQCMLPNMVFIGAPVAIIGTSVL